MKQHPIPNLGRKIIEYPLDAAATFKNGSFVVLDSDEECIAVAAGGVLALGVAVSAANGGTGYGEGGAREIDLTKCLVAVAGPGRTFLMEGDDAPVQDDIGKSYGIGVDTDGIPFVDGTETTDTLVTVVNIDTDRNLYEVVVIAAKQQIPA